MFKLLNGFNAKAFKMPHFAGFLAGEWPSKSTYVEKKLLTVNEVALQQNVARCDAR